MGGWKVRRNADLGIACGEMRMRSRSVRHQKPSSKDRRYYVLVTEPLLASLESSDMVVFAAGENPG